MPLSFLFRSLYFYTPRYTPHTFQFFQTSLLFQAPEVYTYSDTMISTIPKASTKDQFNLFSTFVSFKRNPPIRTEIGIEACRIELNAATSPPILKALSMRK